MRRAALLLLLLALGGCSFTQDTAAPPNELTSYEQGAVLQEAWSGVTGDAFNRRWVRMVPYAAGDRLYTADVAGQVSAWRPGNGDLRWRTDVGDWLSAGVGGGDGAVYVGTSKGTVIALSAKDGSERWRQDVKGELLAPPATGEGMVVVRTVDGRIVALDPKDGSRLWTYSADVPSLTLRGNGKPIVVPGGVLAGLDNGKVIALSDKGGRPLWEATVAPPQGRSPIDRMVDIDGALGVGRGVLYAATYQGRIAQIEPNQGQIQWSRDMSSYAGLDVDGQRVYVTDADSNVRALDPDSGATLWRQDKLAHRRLTAPIVIPGTNFLVVGDYDGYVHVLSRADGRIVARRRVDGFGILADPVPLSDGRFAVQTQGAHVVVLNVHALD